MLLTSNKINLKIQQKNLGNTEISQYMAGAHGIEP